jgi:hypothetical protein
MSNPNIATTRSIYLKTSVVKIPASGTKTVVKNFNNSNQVLKISSLYISQQGPEQKMPNPLAPNETYTFPWSVQTAMVAGTTGTASSTQVVTSTTESNNPAPPPPAETVVGPGPGSPPPPTPAGSSSTNSSTTTIAIPGVAGTAGTAGTGGVIGPAGTPPYAPGKWTEVQVTFVRSLGNDITFNLGDGVGNYDLASNLLIKYREVVHAITRDTPIYLGEGDSIQIKVLKGDAGVQVVCSYEKVTNYEDFEVRIGGVGWESGIN